MAIIKPFRGVRPALDKVAGVASPPYDVLDSKEARELVTNNPNSFLHVVKPEIDLPESVDLYDEAVYQKGKENLYNMIKNGVLIQDNEEALYVYKLVMGDVKQVGIVAATSIEDYENDVIKKHEHTRADKEADRIKHIETLNANTGPVFLTYPAQENIDNLINEITAGKPEYDFVADDNISHTFWVVKDKEKTKKLVEIFSKIKYLYVADGHHRSASGTIVGQRRRKSNPNHTGKEEYNFFLSVIFPDNQLYVMDYNRVVKDLNSYSNEDFIKKLEENFTVTKSNSKENYKPKVVHNFGMYLDGDWYELKAKSSSFDVNDPVESLDVSILQKNVLGPLLNIQDPRTDKRIEFVGGIRGLGELKKMVDSENIEAKVAFSMYPTSIEELMKIADAGKVMPPKSTWFEPKLRSGMAVHLLD